MDGQLRETIRQKIVDAQAMAIPDFTRRDIRLPGVKGKAVAVVGMRRAGKSTFLWQVLSDHVAGGTPREGLLYFSFEDERLAGMTASDLTVVVEEFYRLNPDWRDKRRALLLLDEVQQVPGWEGFARRLLDTEKIELFISGSSAKLLSREVATSMRGRAMETQVFPFSFREHLRHLGKEPKLKPGRLTKAALSALDKQLRLYLEMGGFPEAQGIELRDRLDLLRSYVDVVLLRDVIERHEVSHPMALRWLVRQLLGNAGGAFSVNKFYGDLKSQGIAIAKDTLHLYLSYFEDAFLIFTVSLAADSERRRMVNLRKAYPIDPGMIPVFDRSGRGNVGHSLKTAVALELFRRGAEVSYVSTSEGYEVDFRATYANGRRELIQVCASLDDKETREREVRGLLSAARENRRARMLLITLTPETVRDVPKEIELVGAPPWLLREG